MPSYRSDPYAVLGVEPTATHAELKKAYRKRAMEWHPDRNSAPDAEARFKEVAWAWELLGDEDRRRAFDREQGRASRGELPEEFLADVGDAMDRAEYWIRSVVLPHYARYWRGHGLEMAARLLADVEDLDHLEAERSLPAAGWLRRRRVRSISDRIVVTALLGYDGAPSVLIRGRKLIEIAILPLPLYKAGFTDTAELDRAVLQLLLGRFAQVMAGGSLRGLGGDPEVAIDRARVRDSERVRSRALRIGGWSIVAAIIALMLIAAFNGW